MIKKIISKLNAQKIRLLLPLIIACLCMVASLGAFIDFSFACFSNNQQVGAGGLQLGVDSYVSTITTQSGYAFKYDGVNGAMAIDLDGYTEKIQMSEYDNIFTDRNINTPLIIRVEVDGVPNNPDDKITVNVPCSSNYTDNGTNPLSFVSGDTILSYLSNVIKIRIGCGLLIGGNLVVDNYDPTQASDVPIIYEGARDHLITEDSTVVVGTFVNDSTKTKVKTISLDFPQSIYSAFITNTDELVFYIEVDYDNVLINSYNLNSVNDGGQVIFADDFGTIRVEQVRV